jgi:hypothetical protein
LECENTPEGTKERFVVDIIGSIRATTVGQNAVLQVTLEDVTEGLAHTRPVIEKGTEGTSDPPQPFCFQTPLGVLHDAVITLSNWTTVARLETAWFTFAHRGPRALVFHVRIKTAPHNDELAHARYLLDYNNQDLGYIDLKENQQQVKVLAIAPALAVAAMDGKFSEGELGFIRGWALANINLKAVSLKSKKAFEKSLQRAAALLQTPDAVDLQPLCQYIARLAPLAVRYDILEFFLYVARASGSVTRDTLQLLTSLAAWLQADTEHYRTLVEKVLPVHLHETLDKEIVLGVKDDMPREEILKRLNREYVKWNARVTNADKNVQHQADKMLELIAQARHQYAQ